MTRVLFVSDVHGSEVVFLKFLKAREAYKSDVMILGGDLTGKVIIPIVPSPNNGYEAIYPSEKRHIRSESELPAAEKNIRYSGFYPYRTTTDEVEELKSDRNKMSQLFQKLIPESIKRWVELADERLSGKGVKLFMMPGNDDALVIDDLLASENVINPEGKCIRIDPYHEMISTGYSNISPWHAPRDISEEELSKRIESMISQVQEMKNCIFQFHCPPYDSKIDEAPELDDFKPKARVGSGVLMMSVGSHAVRSAIEKNQPLLGLHGHIHESKGVANIGRTLCINAGSEYSQGILKAAIVNLEKDKVKGHMLISG